MEELSLLGNAAAVPIIVTLTQFLKKIFSFRHRSDIVCFLVTVVVCFGWKFYYTPTLELEVLVDSGWINISKEVIRQLIISFATWLSASKSYDLFYGNKKRTAEHRGEKDILLAKIKNLESVISNGDEKGERVKKNSQVDDKLRSILESH